MSNKNIERLIELSKEMQENQEKMTNLMEEEINKRRKAYNKEVRFDGDIIITDPCYIMNKENDDRFDKDGNTKSPCWWDFVSKTTSTVCDSGFGSTYLRYNMPKPEDYPDCRKKTLDDYKDNVDKLLAQTEMLLDSRGKKPVMFSPTLQAEWDAYHKASEEWHSVPHSDWERCGCGEDMSVLGLNTYLVGDTIYGDWSCTTFNSDTKEKLGQFCADAGMVGIFLLDEVLKYNPNFDYHIERPWTTTLIKDFHGTVELKLKKHKKYDDEVQVVGKGNVNFVGKQTGL